MKQVLINIGLSLAAGVVCLPPGLAEERLGGASFHIAMLVLSLFLTLISMLTLFHVGKRSVLAIRFVSMAMIAYWLFMLIMFNAFDSPRWLPDMLSYWPGTLTSILLIGFQVKYNSRRYISLFRSQDKRLKMPNV